MQNLRAQLQVAFDETCRKFPFPKYIDDSTFYEVFAILKELQKHVPHFEGLRLLDVGSGPMDKTAIFQHIGFRCHAVDDLADPWHFRDNNIEKIKNFAKTVGIDFFHQEPGKYTIPFERESFDVVCSLAVIEHLHESPRGILNAMGELLKPGGILVVTMPNSVNLRKRLSVLLGKTNHVPIDQLYFSEGTWRGHVREYTLAETVYVCRESGFDILSGSAFEAMAYARLSGLTRQIFLALGKMIPTLQSGLLVIARKPPAWKPQKFDPEVFRKALEKGVPRGVT